MLNRMRPLTNYVNQEEMIADLEQPIIDAASKLYPLGPPSICLKVSIKMFKTLSIINEDN